MKKTTLVLGLLVSLCLLSMAGCGILQEMVGTDPIAVGLSQLLNGLTQNQPVTSDGVVQDAADGRTQTVKMFFADAQGTKLVLETREIPHTLSLARETVRQWLLGPSAEGSLQRTVSAATALRDIDIKEGVATVDLSHDFLTLNGSIKAEVALYSLVNTLCQFPTVNEVVVHIDGEPIDAYHTLSTDDLQWKGDLVDVSAGGTASSDQGFSVEPEADEAADGAADTSSPSNINIFY